LDNGITYIESSGSSGHGGAISHSNSGVLSFGIDFSTGLIDFLNEKEKDFPGYKKERINHIAAHELGHKIWQNDLTEEQKQLAEKAEKKSLYARNLEEGTLQSAAGITEENFCENFAWNLTQIHLGTSEGNVQEDLKPLLNQIQALSENKPVPENVLKDYPELKKKESASDS